jgi:citrate synthase
MIHESLKKVMDAFNYDAHPMGMLISTVAAMSTFYPEARNVHDPESRTKQIHRLIAKMPTVAAFATSTRWACRTCTRRTPSTTARTS